MGITRRSLVSASLLLLLPKVAGAQETPAPKDRVLYFISPIDGASVRGSFDVRFGLKKWASPMRATRILTVAITIY